MNAVTLPIQGKIPATTTSTREVAISMPEDWDFMSDLYQNKYSVDISIFPPSSVELADPACLQRDDCRGTITLKEFYQRIFFMPPDALIAIVIHNKDHNSYRLYNTEVVNQMDYDWDKKLLIFWSVFRTKGKLIEFSQISNAVYEDTGNGEWTMFRKRHNSLLRVESNTPIILDTTYGRKEISNVVTFSGIAKDKPQMYIGLVIEEH